MDYEAAYNELLPKYEKLVEVDWNKTKALKEERSRRQDADDKAEKLLVEVEDRKVKATKKDEVITAKEAEIAKTQEEIKVATERAAKYDESIKKWLDEKLAKIPDDKKDFVNKALAGRSAEEQMELADWFVAEYSKPDFKAGPWAGWDDPQKKPSEFEKAKTAWDIEWMIANAPSISTSD